MAQITEAGRQFLIVPFLPGERPLMNNFVNFLWERDLCAFLTKVAWIKEEGGLTRLGLRMSPGTC